MLSDRAARVSYYSFLYALAYFEGYGDGLEGEAVGIVGAGPRRGHVWLGWLVLMNFACRRVDGVACYWGLRCGIRF